jgi:hypothetical protein
VTAGVKGDEIAFKADSVQGVLDADSPVLVVTIVAIAGSGDINEEHRIPRVGRGGSRDSPVKQGQTQNGRQHPKSFQGMDRFFGSGQKLGKKFHFVYLKGGRASRRMVHPKDKRAFFFDILK